MIIVTTVASSSHVETWQTRFGTSVRVVERSPKGQFLNHKSANQLVKLQSKFDKWEKVSA
jgi:hypothetical protein